MKCKYRYKYGKYYKGKQCMHEAVPGSDYCIWHQKKDGKTLSDLPYKKDNTSKNNLREAYFKKADLAHAHFTSSDLYYSTFFEANLKFAQFMDAKMVDTNLNGANLEFAKLQRANLRKASIKFAILKDADLDGTLMNKDTDLTCTFLNGADLKNAKKLQYARVNNICVEEIVADILDNAFYETSWPSYNKTKYREVFSKYLKEYLENQCRDYINDRNNNSTHIKEIPENFLKFIVDTIFPRKTNVNNSKTNKENDDIDKPFLFSRCEQIGIRLKFYDYARDVYVNLKNYFKDAGLYDKSSIYFIGEYRVRGKMSRLSGDISRHELFKRVKHFFNGLIFWKLLEKSELQESNLQENGEESRCIKKKSGKFYTLLWEMFKNYSAFSINRISSVTSLYGESVWRVFFTAFSIILIYASIYSLRGSIIGTDMAVPVHNFWTNLYFSIVTFTTLGYGDLHPVSSTFTRMIAGSEAFLGAFILAYFVVVVSRKIMR